MAITLHYITCISNTRTILSFSASHLFRVGILTRTVACTPSCLCVCHQHMALPVCRTALLKLWGSSRYQWSRSESLWHRLSSHNLETKQWDNIRELVSQFLRVCTQRMLQKYTFSLAGTIWGQIYSFQWQRTDNLMCFWGGTNGTSTPVMQHPRVYEKPRTFSTWDDSRTSISLVCWWKRRLCPNKHLSGFFGFLEAFPSCSKYLSSFWSLDFYEGWSLQDNSCLKPPYVCFFTIHHKYIFYKHF